MKGNPNRRINCAYAYIYLIECIFDVATQKSFYVLRIICSSDSMSNAMKQDNSRGEYWN